MALHEALWPVCSARDFAVLVTGIEAAGVPLPASVEGGPGVLDCWRQLAREERFTLAALRHGMGAAIRQHRWASPLLPAEWIEPAREHGDSQRYHRERGQLSLAAMHARWAEAEGPRKAAPGPAA